MNSHLDIPCELRSRPPGRLIAARLMAAILKLSDLQHYHCLPSHLFANRDDFCFSAQPMIQLFAVGTVLCPKSGRLAPDGLLSRLPSARADGSYDCLLGFPRRRS
jgi:hypothetical protein